MRNTKNKESFENLQIVVEILCRFFFYKAYPNSTFKVITPECVEDFLLD